MDQLQIQSLLEEILGSGNVYFQPPPTVAMQYPAIVYKRDISNTQFADNIPYRRTKRYMVTVIDKDPNTPIFDKVADLPMCTHSRSYSAKQLHHDVFDIYF